MQRPTAARAIGLGVLGSCAVLSKYNSIVFLGCLVLASCLHPERRRFWRSAMPFLVIAGATPLVLAHLAWLWNNDFLPFRYFSGLRHSSPTRSIMGGASFIASQFLYFLPAGLVLVGAVGRKHLAVRPVAWRGLEAVLVVLALGPALLSATACAGLLTRCPSPWGLQNLYLAPALLIRMLGFRSDRTVYRRISAVVLAGLIIMVAAAPGVAWFKFNNADRSAIDPRSEVARRLTQWWHDAYETPLRIVAGDESYALATSFYSADHPSYFISSNPRLTPWISPERLQREGALFICNDDDEQCENEAMRVSADRGQEKQISELKNYLGSLGQDYQFSYFVLRPSSRSVRNQQRD